MKQKITEIRYGSTTRQTGDFFPADAPDAPGILLIHGGGWCDMDRSAVEGIARFLQQNGFSVFNIDYRLCGEALWPACGDDCLAALTFLRQSSPSILPNLDRSRLAVVGASAGGHLALMTALRAPAGSVRAAVSISGITDLFTYRKNDSGCIRKLLGKNASVEAVEAASPLHILTAQCPPVLLTHSMHDNVVDIQNAYLFMDRAKELGAPVEFFEYLRPRIAEYDHCIWVPGSNRAHLHPELESILAAFLRRCVNTKLF